MKYSVLFQFILALAVFAPSGAAFASSVSGDDQPDFFCYGAMGSENAEQSKTVAKGTILKVRTLIPVCAYVWYSSDGLLGAPLPSPIDGTIGGNYIVDYEIDTSKQDTASKTYTFEVALVWDRHQPTTPPTECKINVVLETNHQPR